MSDEGERKFLTIQDAAREAGISEQAIRNAIYRRRISTVEMYGRLLIDRAAFEAYRKNTKMGRPRKTTHRQQE